MGSDQGSRAFHYLKLTWIFILTGTSENLDKRGKVCSQAKNLITNKPLFFYFWGGSTGV
jgi:hypothetical protein